MPAGADNIIDVALSHGRGTEAGLTMISASSPWASTPNRAPQGSSAVIINRRWIYEPGASFCPPAVYTQ
jgi:hypothetical protein